MVDNMNCADMLLSDLQHPVFFAFLSQVVPIRPVLFKAVIINPVLQYVVLPLALVIETQEYLLCWLYMQISNIQEIC